ncbi:putative hydro-lyase [Rossellomorea aquimaris]|uniref:putative hydro-lyase n=1 Tax=Rossellomorea aquimaris TaxID=189382 RepID=UPI001CD29CE9|nr:putative hydro-lyase [Rossellomorea aquimaris]MCA1054380.1 putative hydro-lyase [Rossellomorea aquimaris]
MLPTELRSMIRSGTHTTHTSGVCEDYVQTNLVILPKEYAFDFLLFTMRNQKSCPVIEVLEDGRFVSDYAKDSDIRTDLPLYHVYEHGRLVEKKQRVDDCWRDDFVSFLIGCSFTFESQLIKGGIPLRHIQENKNVAMYKTSIQTESAGVFKGETVVSMRPIPDSLVQQAADITSLFPEMHGSPLHIGDPAEIGIEDITRPDYGDFVGIKEGETPVFWACGVTPQAVALASKIPTMITHAPGHMFVTDWKNEEYLQK